MGKYRGNSTRKGYLDIYFMTIHQSIDEIIEILKILCYYVLAMYQSIN